MVKVEDKPGKKSTLRAIAAAAIVAVGACLVAAILLFGMDARSATTRDFIQYWAQEQLLAHGGNPYDPAAILQLEKSAGLRNSPAIVNLGPPVALFFALPLGWVGTRVGLILWSLAILVCLALSVWLLWLVHGRPQSRWHVIAFAFPPALWCLVAGQLGIFFLLEIALFLLFIRTRPWLAGVALVFCSLKPQLFLPGVVVLVLWSLARKRFGALCGLAGAFAASCALTLLVDRHVWSQYRQIMHISAIMDQFIPTVATALRFAVDRHAKWIGFLPEIGACIWAVWYFLSRRDRWDWRQHGLLVLLVSAACTPYSWYTDQAMLFPAVLAGLYRAEKSLPALALFGAVAGAGMFSLILDIPLYSAFYVWTAPAWLVWYLYATRGAAAHAAAQPA